MHVRVGEIAELGELLRLHVTRMPGVQRVETAVSVKTINSRAALNGCLRP